MEERRKHLRVKIKTEGEAVRQDNNKKFEVMLGDISFGGVEIFSEESFEAEDRLEITFSVLNEKGEKIEETFSGGVRWVQPVGEAFVGGFQFDQAIEKDTYPEIYHFILEARGYLK